MYQYLSLNIFEGHFSFRNYNTPYKNCQNRDTWEINAGNQYSAEELLNKILRTFDLYKPYTKFKSFRVFKND